MQRDVVTVERFYTEQAGALGLKLLAGAGGLKDLIREPTVNRPGLALAGFTKYFASKRLQVIGAGNLLVPLWHGLACAMHVNSDRFVRRPIVIWEISGD